MSTEEGLLQAICAEPDDDGLRLIYADWLEERGGDADSLARAEFIRVQVDLASMADDDPRRGELEARERDLLTAHEERWVAPFRRFRPEAWGFARGFIEEMVLPVDVFLTRASQLFGSTPLLSVRLLRGAAISGVPVQTLAEFPPLARLRGLDLAGWYIGNDGFLSLMRSSYLPRLRSLGLADNALVVDDAVVVSATVPSQLEGLSALDLSLNDVGDEGAEVLARLPALRSLATLSLRTLEGTYYDEAIRAVGARALADSVYLAGLVALDLAHNAIGDAGLRSLVGSPNLTQLTRLNVSANGIGEIGDAGIQQLISSPYLERLSVLDLSSNPLGVAGANALAEWRGMEQLSELNLAACGIRNRGLMRLLASQHCLNLRVLNLVHNDLDDCGGYALAEAPYLPSNVRLDLRGNRISSSCLATLRSHYVHPVLSDEELP